MNPPSETRVSILMGSDSDLTLMSEAARILERLKVTYEMHVTSAHRSPDRTVKIVQGAAARGVCVFIVGAGHAAHLAGVVAAYTTLPVLGVPLPSSDLKGLDSLLATVQMPAGIPVATLADRIRHVVQAAFNGRRIVIFSGGPAKGREGVMEEIRGIAEGGAFGSIIGRNSFQRPKSEAIDLLHEVMDIYAQA